MTITMTAKNQITIPKKIAHILDLKKGALFEVFVRNKRIELVPVEVKAKVFTREMYKKLDALSAKERGEERLVTKKVINKFKK